MNPEPEDLSGLAPPRGLRHECHRCGRQIPKAHRVFLGIVFCATCYAREFSRRPCFRCGQSVRLHKSQETGLCRECERSERRCARCDKTVPRAALVIDGKPVCPACRRYFPPFLQSTRRDGHETCSVCRKHRRVTSRDGRGRPLCSRCSCRDRRLEVAEIDERYWHESLLQRHAKVEARLNSEWCRNLFAEFVAHEVARVPAKRLALALNRHVSSFATLESRFGGRDEIDADSILARYGAEEMRRAQSLFEYLRTVGIGVPTRDQSEAYAEKRRVQSLLDDMKDSVHLRLLERFRASFDEPDSRGLTVKAKSMRLSLRAACGLVRKAGDQDLCQAVLEAYLQEVPGQRAAVSRFVGFLSREAGIAVSLPARRARKHHRVTRSEGDRALARCLGHLDRDRSFLDLRAAVAGTLIGLWGIPLVEVVRLNRDAAVVRDGGSLTIEWPKGTHTKVDSRVALGIGRYLMLRDNAAGHNGGFLFPGRPASQHVTEGTVGTRLEAWGCPVRVLAMSARNWIKKFAELN